MGTAGLGRGLASGSNRGPPPWPEAGSDLRLAHVVGTNDEAEAFRAIACDSSVDDGLRLEAAEQLPGLDPTAAAEAFRVIASDANVDDGLRSSAAEQLAGLDPRAAV